MAWVVVKYRSIYESHSPKLDRTGQHATCLLYFTLSGEGFFIGSEVPMQWKNNVNTTTMARTGMDIAKAYMQSIGKPLTSRCGTRQTKTLFLEHIMDGDKMPGLNTNEFGRAMLIWVNSGDDSKESFLASIDTAKESNAILLKKKRKAARVRRRAVLAVDGHKAAICNMPSHLFYQTEEWKALRYAIFEKYGNFCACCGRSPKDRITLHIDHIKPRSLFPELALDPFNLQVLCADCNQAKSNIYATDWRLSE